MLPLVILLTIVLQCCTQPVFALYPVWVYALPVGQGDCTYIRCPDGSATIFDMGSNSSGKDIYWNSTTVKNWINDMVTNYGDTVKNIFVSHPDSENYNYLYKVFDPENTTISQVFYAGSISDFTDPYMVRWLSKLNNTKGITVTNINNGKPCFYPNCDVVLDLCNNVYILFTILAANQPPTTNSKSVVMTIRDTSSLAGLLLTGDFEGLAQDGLISTLNNAGNLDMIKSDYYKLSCHGASEEANSQAFLNAINPDATFSSSAYPSQGHKYPSCETYERFLSISNDTDAQQHRSDCYQDSQHSVRTDSIKYAIYSTAPQPGCWCLVQFDLTIPWQGDTTNTCP